jgi:hypothetical protein
MDSDSSIHISRDRDKFTNFCKAPTGHYALCGSRTVPILGYREIDIELSSLLTKNPKRKLLRLNRVAYCLQFLTNLVSLTKLEERGMDWCHRTGEIRLRGDIIGYTRRIHHQYVIEQDKSSHTILATSLRKPQKSKRPIPSSANSDLWHLRMGHVGPEALAQLGNQTLGVRINGPSTVKCPDCALAKITQQISRIPDPNKSTRPFHKIHVDWFDLKAGWDNYQHEGKLVCRCIIITCEATGMALTYFTNRAREDKNLPIL